MKNILVVAGTRPNFIKISQFREVASHWPDMDLRIVHTQQHYDDKMAQVFFKQLHLQPDYFLNTLPAEPEAQMTSIHVQLLALMQHIFIPDLVMVVGDVNSTRAAAETAAKLKIPVAHIESGLRSFDTSMPEEHNRVIADNIAAWHFVTEQSGITNLHHEGINNTSICFCGNTMIDTLIAFEEEINNNDALTEYGLIENNFALITLHRPSNVDSKEDLDRSVNLITTIAIEHHIVFPVHPRTLKKLQEYALTNQLSKNKNIIITPPLDYFAFQKLIKECKFIVTDSGGIQEEATFRKKPCLTIRPNTERPSTIDIGSNTLVHWDIDKIQQLINNIQNGTYKKGTIPPLWDGKATERIFQFLAGVL